MKLDKLNAVVQCGVTSLEDPLTAIKDGDVDKLGRLLPLHRQLDTRTRLLTAAITKGKEDSRASLVEVILKDGADPNVWDSAFHRTPLHLAMERGLSEVVRILLEHNARPDARTSSRETGLHCVIRGLKRNLCSDESQAIVCMQLLLTKCVNNLLIDAQDDLGEFTAIHLASKFEQWNIVKFLLTHKAHIDVSIKGTSARKIIRDTSSDELAQLVNTALIKPEPKPDLVILLQNSLKDNETDEEFLKLINENLDYFKQIKDESYGKRTFLQLTCIKGFLKATEALLTVGADVNLISMEDSKTPALLATVYEHSDVLGALLASGKCNLAMSTNEYGQMTALHVAVITNNDVHCLAMLLKHAEMYNLNINKQDYRDYTALHYAAKMGKTEMIDLLLQNNANIFIQDYENIPAFFELDPKSVNNIFDKAINTEKFITQDDYTVKFNYNCLIMKKCETKSTTPSTSTKDVNILVPNDSLNFQPEMTSLEMLADSPVHRHLLNHPLIRSFLHLKWYRIYLFFYFNFFFYLLFTISLSFHVYNIVTTNCSTINKDDMNENYNNNNSITVLRVITAILLFFLIIREIFQAILSPWKYINILENWIEIILILLTTIVIIEPNNIRTLQSISAFAILLAFTELILLAGRHPSLSTYIKMFFRVLTSFGQLLLWYSILIIGFGFSFYIVFRNCQTQNFFFDLYTSLFKTFIMLTGEFEAGELTFDTLAITSHIVFILFIFFIAIVLLNLLNGLAVSDTQAIRNDAQVHCCIAQVRLYSELESTLLGGTTFQNTKIKECLGKLILVLHRLKFDEKQDYVLRVMVKQENKMLPDIRICKGDCTDLPYDCFMRCTCLRKACRWCLVFNTIVSEARNIAEQKGKMSENQQILERLIKLEEHMKIISKSIEATQVAQNITVTSQ